MYRHKILSIERSDSYPVVRIGGLKDDVSNLSQEQIKRKIDCCSKNSFRLRINEYEELQDKFNLNVNGEFASDKDWFDDALEHMLFGRTITDVDKEIVIPSLINRQTPDDRGIDYEFIHKWWMDEKRVYRNPENQWDLIATDYYTHLNTILPDNIRVSQLDSSDSRINTRVKGQCGYFLLEHPKGDCYGALHGAKNVLDLFEFKQ